MNANTPNMTGRDNVSTSGEAAVSVPSRSPVVVSARTRILGWSVLLLAASFLIGTGATYVVLSRRADARIAAELRHEADEFAALPSGVGRPGNPSRVAAKLHAATARAVPEAEIVLIGLRAGRLYSVSAGNTLRGLGLAPRDIARLSAVTTVTHATIGLEKGPARVVAIPVRIAGDPTRGAFVAAVYTGPEHSAVSRLTAVQLEVGAAALLLASLLAWVAAGRVLRPIRATTELARSITEADLSQRLPVRGADEVSQMAMTFNAMLDRLQTAFAAQRRFLADAGHELRTPITIIQGNLDTVASTDPEDTETLALVSEELARMTRLVEELSLLAAAAHPDFLRPAPTDLPTLAASLVAKATALGDRGWRARSELHGWALLDAHRVTQAVMQLAANAVAHTAPQVPVELAFAETDGFVTFAVIDHGAGVAAADRALVFERFARLDRKHADSTGLGLSIVAAIAAAHGGKVTLDDTPGGGATFTVHIPRRTTAPRPAEHERPADDTMARTP